MGAEKKGRTVGSDAAKSAGEKVLRQSKSITVEDLERLSLRVKQVDREHGEFMRVWLMPHALQCVASNRRFSVSEYCDRKSWQGVDAPDHNAQPIVARLLAERLPECRPYIELRRSKYDAVFAERAAVRADNGA